MIQACQRQGRLRTLGKPTLHSCSQQPLHPGSAFACCQHDWLLQDWLPQGTSERSLNHGHPFFKLELLLTINSTDEVICHHN